MISKGYHYVINLGIFSNFLYQYRQDLWRRENPDFPEFICYDRSYAKDQYRSILIFGKGPIVADELGGTWVLPSPQILKPIIHGEFRQSIIGTAPLKFFVFYFQYPCQFYPQYNLRLQTLSCFHFPYFYFAYIFLVLQKAPPSQLLSGAIP